MQMALIDWHDVAVVGIMDLADNKDEDLLPSMTHLP